MNQQEKEYRLATIGVLWKFLIPAIILIGFTISLVFGSSSNDIDNNVNSKKEIIQHLNVVDSSYQGFRVVYLTKNAVSPQRLEEIESRKHIKDAFRKIRKEVPLHFDNNMLYTDIYDFVDVILQYEVDPDLEIHNIFVEGKKKTDLYAQYNPNLPGCATWIDPNTEQGALYLKAQDIIYQLEKEKRTYRYWKCSGYTNGFCLEFSKTDEQFSHFTEADRIR